MKAFLFCKNETPAMSRRIESFQFFRQKSEEKYLGRNPRYFSMEFETNVISEIFDTVFSKPVLAIVEKNEPE